VFGVVERHKGEMKIDSKPGKGTSVHLIFPIDREFKEEIIIKNISKSIPALNILYVEDDTTIADMIKQILEKRNHSVTWSNNGKTGLEKFKDNFMLKKPFDLVITDLGMIQMDGITLSKHIKKISPQTPVILFTGWGSVINRDELTTVDCLVKKPITKEELFKTISSLFQ
jgi:DNA-binding response OmpR family regulator